MRKLRCQFCPQCPTKNYVQILVQNGFRISSPLSKFKGVSILQLQCDKIARLWRSNNSDLIFSSFLQFRHILGNTAFLVAFKVLN